jgi:non-specific serine/threonine protein kinase
MLETLRRHAAGLARAADDGRRRHTAWCAEVATSVLTCPGPREAAWIDVAQAELAELRAALERCPPSATGTGLRIAADLYFFWDIRGYLGEGRAHLARLLARPEAEHDPDARGAALQSLGLLLLWQDDLAGARRALEEAADLAERRGDAAGWAWCAGSLGIAHFAGGDVDAIAARAERGLAVAREEAAWMPLLRTTCGLGLVRWAQGRADEARALLEENARLAAPSPWGAAKAGWFLGWFAFLDGDLEEADRRFRDGAAAFAHIRDRRSLPDCHDGAACVAAARGDATQALELFATADGLRERAGSRRNAYLRPHCDRARDGARAAAAAPASHGVTPREREVARLVADGLTNRQIGRRLGISERTAERHTENLRAKLGVGTRAQIAAWAAAVPTPPAADVAGVPDTGRTRTPLG